MPPQAWSAKRARQYEHIKQGRHLNIEGRSKMTKAQLERAVDRKNG
jgi:hypothetical protein